MCNVINYIKKNYTIDDTTKTPVLVTAMTNRSFTNSETEHFYSLDQGIVQIIGFVPSYSINILFDGSRNFPG